MGVEPDIAHGAMRISLGWNTTEEDVKQFTEAFNKMAAALSPKQRETAA